MSSESSLCKGTAGRAANIGRSICFNSAYAGLEITVDRPMPGPEKGKSLSDPKQIVILLIVLIAVFFRGLDRKNPAILGDIHVS